MNGVPTGRSSYKILVAEDSAPDVGLVRMALAEQNVDCDLVVIADGARVISYIETIDSDPQHPPLDLVLLDMHLPKHGGDDILTSLRATERYAQTPVIVMTASDSPEDHANAERHAALHYFRKPLNLAEFMQLGVIVKEILESR